MAKCLMLDVDGVLVGGRPTDGRRWDHGLEEDLGLPRRALAEQFFARAWADIIIGKQDLLPALTESLQRIGTDVTAPELAAYWFSMDARIDEAVLSDMRHARARGVPVYLTTNQEHERARYLMDTMGLRDEVDGIVYSARARCRKPQPAFFKFAAEATGRHAGEFLLVDDTPQNIAGARDAGWAAVHWDGGQTLASLLQRHLTP